jgi:hypothetical protein
MEVPPLGPSKVQWALLMTRFWFVATVMDVLLRNLLRRMELMVVLMEILFCNRFEMRKPVPLEG